MCVEFKSLCGWSVLALLSVTSVAATSDLRLLEAVKNQNKDAVRSLLKQHVDVNVPEPDGATALHWAAHRDDLDTADMLILAGADPNATNEYGVTPLELACTNGNAAMVEHLLQAGANPNAALLSGETALMTAARTGNVRSVRVLLARGADANAKETSQGQTALMWAVAEQHPDVVQALIDHGADVHARSDVRRVFVSRGEPLGNHAVGEFYDESTLGEIERGGFTPLLFAARQGDVAAAKLLLAAGANINDIAADGNSVLVIASHSGHGVLAAFLLGKGADPNVAGAGYTALHAAVLRGDLELVKALLAYGANPDAQLTKGTPVRRRSEDFILRDALIGATPFLLASKFIEVGIMNALVAVGADPLLALEDGTTPLMAAAGSGWGIGQLDRRDRAARSGSFPADPEDDVRALGAVKLAADLGADVNAVNRAGDTALHAAASKGLSRVVQFLADRGAQLDVKNKRGQTPLMTASGPRAQGTANVLRVLGAKE